MDLVIAIKPQPNRVVKKTTSNRITVLLSDSRTSADKTVLHRDNAYLSKLQGTCFKCKKLTEIPPVEVCVNPPPPPPPPDGCIEQNDYCQCYNCHVPTPVFYDCLGRIINGEQGYGYSSANSIQNSGSGYWVGLQGNNFYSNPLNGGWVVAVECGTSDIVGAFPVSGANYGYGVGSILGYSVMIYPAAVVYGAGYRPANGTTFPLLALTTQEGNQLVSGFTITGANTALGTPYDPESSTYDPSSTFQYFCNTGPAVGVNPTPLVGLFIADRPRSCLTKYGSSSCDIFNGYRGVQDNSEYSFLETRFLYDVRGSAGFNLDELETNSVISYSRSDGSSYCSATENAEQLDNFAYDALGGICSEVDPAWPDTPTCMFSNCHGCIGNPTCNPDPPPCQFINNLTMGNYNFNYGGYNAATGDNYAAIGPSNPPTQNGGIVVDGSASFWENYWGWDEDIHCVEFTDMGGNNQKAFIPPIGTLQRVCGCPSSSQAWVGVLYIEHLTNTDCAECQKRSNLTGYVITKPGSSCGAACRTCPRNDMSSFPEEDAEILGRAGDYGLVGCCSNNDNPGDESIFNGSTITPAVGTSIWWLNSLSSGPIGQGVTENSPMQLIIGEPKTTGTLDPPGSYNSCLNAMPTSTSFSNSSAFSDDDCNRILEYVSGEVQFNSEAFYNCTGFDDLNDSCFKASNLPISASSSTLIVNPDIDASDTSFVNNIGFNNEGSFQSLKDFICPDDPNCAQLRYLNGPIGYDSEAGFSQFVRCGIPIDRKWEFPKRVDEEDGNYNCGGIDETKRIAFKRPICDVSVHGECYCSTANIQDPCGCCAVTSVGPGGKIQCAKSNSVNEGCPPCCESGGCNDNSSCPGGPDDFDDSDCPDDGGNGGGGPL